MSCRVNGGANVPVCEASQKLVFRFLKALRALADGDVCHSCFLLESKLVTRPTPASPPRMTERGRLVEAGVPCRCDSLPCYLRGGLFATSCSSLPSPAGNEMWASLLMMG